jgi:hypothetical protein
MRLIAAVAFAGLWLAGCDPASTAPEPGAGTSGPADSAAAAAPSAPETVASEPTTSAFTHSLTQDMFGYYMPDAQVGPDDFQLITLSIGSMSEFQDWEAGRRMATYAPIMMEFLLPGETTERVLPDSYSVTDRRLRMTGVGADYGRVTLDARFEGPVLSDARANLGDSEAPTLVGTITIGDRTWSGVRFFYSAGD